MEKFISNMDQTAALVEAFESMREEARNVLLEQARHYALTFPKPVTRPLELVAAMEKQYMIFAN